MRCHYLGRGSREGRAAASARSMTICPGKLPALIPRAAVGLREHGSTGTAATEVLRSRPVEQLMTDALMIPEHALLRIRNGMEKFQRRVYFRLGATFSTEGNPVFP